MNDKRTDGPQGFGLAASATRAGACGVTASNAGMTDARFARQYDLFQSIVGWLREKPASIGIEAKKQDVYELNTANISFNRMIYLPALLMLVGVIGLGTGVWVTRRR